MYTSVFVPSGTVYAIAFDVVVMGGGWREARRRQFYLLSIDGRILSDLVALLDDPFGSLLSICSAGKKPQNCRTVSITIEMG